MEEESREIVGGAVDAAEVVTATFEAWNEGDWAELERLYHPLVYGRAPEGWPETDADGWPALRRQFERLRETLDEDRVEILALERLDDDVVLVEARWLGRGHTSGLALDLHHFQLHRVEDGRIVYLGYHWDRDSALADTARPPHDPKSR